MRFGHRRTLGIHLLAALGLAAACSEGAPLGGPLEADSLQIVIGRIGYCQTATVRLPLTNPGPGAIALQGATLQQGGAEVGLYATLSANSVPAGGRVELIVTFEPEGPGPVEDTVVVAATNGNIPSVAIAVSAFGPTEAPPLTVDPPRVAFGAAPIVEPDEPGDILPLTVTSSCTRADVELVDFDNATLACDDDLSAYCVRGAELDAEGLISLAAGEPVQLDVEFRPNSTERALGAFSVRPEGRSDDDIRVDLDGRGVEIDLACPSFLQLANVDVRGCDAEPVVCLAVTRRGVEIRGWRLSSDTSEDFAVSTDSMPRRLSQNESQQIFVSYCPSSLGRDEGRLIVETSRGEASVRLSGSGGIPRISVAPDRIDLSNLAPMTPSRTTLVVSNVGSSVLSLREIVVDDPTSGFTTDASSVPSILPRPRARDRSYV